MESGQMGKKEQCRLHFESSHRSDFYRPSRMGTNRPVKISIYLIFILQFQYIVAHATYTFPKFEKIF